MDSAQTPDGRFRRDLQQNSNDDTTGCSADGSCLFDLRRVVELCNPVTVSEVEAPRETAASGIVASAPSAAAKSLLCYQSRLARSLNDDSVASQLGRAVGDRLDPRQQQPDARTLADGNAIYTTPGLGFPAPQLVETKSVQVVCVETDVLSVSLP